MKAVVFTTQNKAYVRDFTSLYVEAEEMFGDYVETVRPQFLAGYLMLIDEAGHLKELPLNIAGSLFYGTPFHNEPIVGDVIIVKDDSRKNPLPLTDNDVGYVVRAASTYAEHFGQEIAFVEDAYV